MKTKTEHSELPWGIEGEPGHEGVVYKYDGTSEQLDANAQFIVQCVNNFYPMLEACKSTLEQLKGDFPFLIDLSKRGLIAKQLEEAIASAEGME